MFNPTPSSQMAWNKDPEAALMVPTWPITKKIWPKQCSCKRQPEYMSIFFCYTSFVCGLLTMIFMPLKIPFRGLWLFCIQFFKSDTRSISKSDFSDRSTRHTVYTLSLFWSYLIHFLSSHSHMYAVGKLIQMAMTLVKTIFRFIYFWGLKKPPVKMRFSSWVDRIPDGL